MREWVRASGLKPGRSKIVGLLAIAAILALVVSVSTALGWVIRFRFYFHILPFERSKSASVAMIDDTRGVLVIRPISDGHQLRMLDFIASVVKGEEPKSVLLGKHGEAPPLNRTTPRYSMGWVNATEITIFGVEYVVWHMEIWARNGTLFMNVRYQGAEDVFEKLYLVEDPLLTSGAVDLMVEAWYGR